jgi:hypothetical protein
LTETVPYRFRGGRDSASPTGGLVMDAKGALYGTTSGGGDPGCTPVADCGTALKLAPPPAGGIKWIKSDQCSKDALNLGIRCASHHGDNFSSVFHDSL